jgi:N-acetylneuraminic acid mutarotase
MSVLRWVSAVGVLALALSGCGGGGGGSAAATTPSPVTTPPTTTPPTPAAVVVEGAVQKGPFIVGSNVIVNRLDDRGKSTMSTLLAQIRDSVGTFSFQTTERGTVQIVATGYYFSELTGQISNGVLSLRSLYEVRDDARQTAHVNILTHLINDRVLQLISTGQMTLKAAIEKAEDELVAALADALPIQNLNEFSHLSLYNGFGSNDIGNAYLLALSTGFYMYAETKSKEFNTATDAELTLVLNQLSTDFADDGRLQPGPFIREFVTAIRSLSPVTIAANLRSRSLVDHPQGLDVPDISRFLSLCAGNFACPWRAGAPAPQVTFQSATAVYDGKVYVFGGNYPASLPKTPWGAADLALAYDPDLNQWQVRRPLPVASWAPTANTIGDKIYVVIGGVGQLHNELYRYDPVTDVWTARAGRPTYRSQFVSAVMRDKLYVIGGVGLPGDGPGYLSPVGPANARGHVEVYDPVGDSWAIGPALPAPLRVLYACSANDRIYVLGGVNSLGDWTPTVLSLSPGASSWSAESQLPAERIGSFACATAGDAIYLVTGDKGPPVRGFISVNDVMTDRVDRYDTVLKTWSNPTRVPTKRRWSSAGVVGTDLVVIGGYDVVGDKPLDVVEIFDIAAPP